MNRLRIMLADDHETVLDGLKMIVNAQADMEVVGEAVDGLQAVTRAPQLLPDVLVMDISMPKMNGLKATEKLKQVCPQVKVLALSRHTDDGYVKQLWRAGACGYVLKQSASVELLHAIRAVAAGGKYIDPKLTSNLMGPSTRRATPMNNEGRKTLSERETEVLRSVALGYSNKEIADRLSLSVKTIEAHKANAMRKLNLSNRIDLVRFAMFQGWLQDN